jgi:mannose-6-phosphate isomerase-like protein (cupin superfamily)
VRVYQIGSLPQSDARHIFGGLVSEAYVSEGGVAFNSPGIVAHSDEPRHVHEHGEIFLILQGRGVCHLDDGDQPLSAGDVAVIEPDENHHLESDAQNPCVVVWLTCGPDPHPDQAG